MAAGIAVTVTGTLALGCPAVTTFPMTKTQPVNFQPSNKSLTVAERELARVTKALDDVAHWRENCHEYDEDMDHEPRAFNDGEEWDILERFALDAKEVK